MSYGVIASKSAHLMLTRAHEVPLPPGSDRLVRLLDLWGSRWMSGRLTLTKLHLTFIANSAGSGAGRLEVSIKDITGVELRGGRLNREIAFRTPAYTMNVRVSSPADLAQRVAALAQTARPGGRTPSSSRGGSLR